MGSLVLVVLVVLWIYGAMIGIDPDYNGRICKRSIKAATLKLWEFRVQIAIVPVVLVMVLALCGEYICDLAIMWGFFWFYIWAVVFVGVEQKKREGKRRGAGLY